MNAILFAGASLGALVALAMGPANAIPDIRDGNIAMAMAESPKLPPVQMKTAAAPKLEAPKADATPDKGFMTRDVKTNPKTGEEEETAVLGFLD